MSVSYVKNAAGIVLQVGLFLLISTVPACQKATPSARQADPWKEYTYPEHGFSAGFPAEPKMVERDNQLNFSALNSDHTQFYFVNVGPLQAKEHAKAFFDSAPQKFGWKVTSQHDIELQGFPGREMNHEIDIGSEPFDVTIRLYLTDDRLYQVSVNAKKGMQDKAEGKKFLDSFKILVDKPK